MPPFSQIFTQNQKAFFIFPRNLRCAEDREADETALRCGLRIFSVYLDRNGVKFWIITEADRSSTCILLPEDYLPTVTGNPPGLPV